MVMTTFKESEKCVVDNMKYLKKLIYLYLGFVACYFVYDQTLIFQQTSSYAQTTITAPISEMDESIKPIDLYQANSLALLSLGRRLFNETALAKNNDIACSSCHILTQGGTSNPERTTVSQQSSESLNIPTVLNSVYNFRQGWNGRAASLKQMIDLSVISPTQMNNSWALVIHRLQADAGYPAQFKEAFGTSEITVDTIQQALTEYLASLVTPDSRFDLHLKGHRSILTPEELAGYRLFRNYGCIVCHQGTNLGGNLFAAMGVMNDYFADKGRIDPMDEGRFEYTEQESDRHVFKVPGLRNVALTAPYFHDGQAQTLEQAVEQMAYYQLGMSLTETEINQIVLFLKTLTGELKT